MKKSIKIVALVAVLAVFGASIEARSLVRSLDRLLNLYDEKVPFKTKKTALQPQLARNKASAATDQSTQTLDAVDVEEEAGAKGRLSDEMRKYLERGLQDKLSETLCFYEDGQDDDYVRVGKRVWGTRRFTEFIENGLFLEEALDVAKKDLRHKDPMIVFLACDLILALIENNECKEETGNLAISCVNNILAMPADIDKDESNTFEYGAYVALAEWLPKLVEKGFTSECLQDLAVKASSYKHQDIAEAAQKLNELIEEMSNSTSQEQ